MPSTPQSYWDAFSSGYPITNDPVQCLVKLNKRRARVFDSIDLALFGQNCNFHLHTTKRKLNKNRKTALKFSKKKRMRTRNVALMRGPCAGMFRGLLHIYLICILHAKIVYIEGHRPLSWRGEYVRSLALFSRLYYSYAACAKLLAAHAARGIHSRWSAW